MNERNFLLPILPGSALLFSCFLGVLFLFALSVRADTSTNIVHSANSTNQPPDISELPIEDLMQLPVPEVYTASKFEQKATEAPSSTTVITSEEIKRYGYRTLADILESVPGFYNSYDRNYSYLGASGVNLGNANDRILLLVNGHRINNDLNDSAAIDTSFILDVDLIDRVEIIHGPGSVLYGNNAFFGVINVITRQGNQVDGAEVSGMYGSYNAYSGRVTIGGAVHQRPPIFALRHVFTTMTGRKIYTTRNSTRRRKTMATRITWMATALAVSSARTATRTSPSKAATSIAKR